jgi:sulfatase modifying factor 1
MLGRDPASSSLFRWRPARGLLLLLGSGLATACLVSFDGYEPLGSAGASGSEAAGAGSGGKPSGGSKANGGRSGNGSGGNEAGDGPSSTAGEAGSDVGGSSSGAGGTTAGGGPLGGDGPMGGSAGAAIGGTAGAATGGSAGASTGGGGNGGSGGNEPKNCPVNLEGPPLIEIPKPGGGFYCMDRTEITNQQYSVFLASNPSTVGQDAACSWNTTYAPDTSDSCASGAGKYDPLARPKVPVSCVDWCDAKRYCAWAGKHLCGAIDGGSNPTSSFADASASQWYRACSKAGTQKFPYGNQYNGTYCNGIDTSGAHPDEVASHANCLGGYSGLFDMSGNVAEWEDSCSAASGASDNCLIRGGSIEDLDVLTPSLLCNSSTPDDDTPSPATAKRNAKNELVGLRCCLDL